MRKSDFVFRFHENRGRGKLLSMICTGLVLLLCGGSFAEPCVSLSAGTESTAQVQEFFATDVTLAGGSDFTWEAWVKPSVDTLTENRIMGQTDWTSEGRLILELRKHSSTGGQNKFVCFYRVNGANARTSAPTAVASAGTWTHVAVTRNGTTLKVYVNGALDSTETNFAGSLPTSISGYPVTFGIGYAFNGALSDVRVWNVERTAAEIANNKDKRLSGTETGLVGYWPMDEGSGVPANAVTGVAVTKNGYDGTADKGTMSWLTDSTLSFDDPTPVESITYTTTAAGGKWSEIAWAPSMPISSKGAKIVLSGAGTFENDLGTFTLNSLSFTKAATLTGNGLVFNANGTENPALSSTGAIICNVNVPMTLNAPLAMTGNNASGSLRLNGAISGTGDIIRAPTAVAIDYLNGNNSAWSGNFDNRLGQLVVSNGTSLGTSYYISTNATPNGAKRLNIYGDGNTFACGLRLAGTSGSSGGRLYLFGSTTFNGDVFVDNTEVYAKSENSNPIAIKFANGVSKEGSSASSLKFGSAGFVNGTVEFGGPLAIGGVLTVNTANAARPLAVKLAATGNAFSQFDGYFGASLVCAVADAYPTGASFGSTAANASGTIDVCGTAQTLGSYSGGAFAIKNSVLATQPEVRICQTTEQAAAALSTSGGLHLIKDGSSLLAVTNAFYVAGTLEVAAGTLRLTEVPEGRLADAVIVREGAILDLGGKTFMCGSFMLNGGTVRNGTLAADTANVDSGEVAATILGENLSVTGTVSYAASVAAAKTLSTNGLVFYMPFDSAETYLNAAGPDNVTLTCQKTVRHTGNNGSAVCDTSEKKFGAGSLYLNGIWPLVPTGGTLLNGEFPASIPTGSSPYTVAFYYKIDPTSKGYAQGMIGYGGRDTGLCNNFAFGNVTDYDHFTVMNNYYYARDARFCLGHNVSRQDGEWHSIVSTWDGTTCRLYDDGAEISAYYSYLHTPNVQPTNFWVGATLNGNAWFGWLDDVAIFNRAVTADEALAYHLHGVAGVEQTLSVAAGASATVSTCDLTSGLVFHLPFDSESTYLTDQGPDRVIFTCKPTPDVANQNTQGTATYTPGGKFGAGCVYLDGKSPLVASAFPGHVPTGSSPYTFACCFKTVSRNNLMAFAGYGNMVSNQGVSFWTENGKVDDIQYYQNWFTDDYYNNGYKVRIDTEESHNDGDWHTFVTSWDGTTWRYWVDGVELLYSTTRGAPNIGNTYFYIGGGIRGTRTWFGCLDEVAIWNRALNDAEVAAYNLVGVVNCGSLANVEVASGATLDVPSGLTLAGTLSSAGTINGNLVLAEGARIVENAEGVPTVSGSVTIEGAGSFLPLAYPSASNRNPTYTILSAQGGFMGDSAAKVQTWSIEGLNAKYGLRFGIYDMLFSARVQSPGLILLFK